MYDGQNQLMLMLRRGHSALAFIQHHSSQPACPLRQYLQAQLQPAGQCAVDDKFV